MSTVQSRTTRTDLHLEPTAPRPTPREGSSFREVLGRTAPALVGGAEAALHRLPGGPVLAAAVRPGVSPGVSTRSSALTSAEGEQAAAEGPGSASAPAGPGLEASLAAGQDMNLYYLRIQEAISAENRAYTTFSNVQKARHDTVKNAIGNIR